MCAQGSRRLDEIYGTSARFIFLTICTWQRRPVLTLLEFGAPTRHQFLRCAVDREIDVCAYTVMPDHVHALPRAKGEKMSKFVWRWKQATGYQWKQERNARPLWQRGFYRRLETGRLIALMQRRPRPV